MCHSSAAIGDEFKNGCCREVELCNLNISIVLPPMPEKGDQSLIDAMFL